MVANYTEFESWSPSLSDKVIIAVIFSCIILTGVLGNVLVIALILFVRKMRSVVNLCLASLALADLIVVVFLPILPLAWLFDLDYSFMGTNFCASLITEGVSLIIVGVFVSSIDRGALVGSTLIFLLIAVERYTVLCRPLKTLGLWTTPRICGLLLVIWAITVGVSLPMGYATRYEQWEYENTTWTDCYTLYDEPWVQWYDIALIIGTYFLPILLLTLLYGKIIMTLKTQVPQSDTKCPGSRAARRSRLQVMVMLVSVLLIFVVCLLPFKIYILLLYLNPELLDAMDYKSHFAMNWFFRLMLYLNHIANPIVYFVMSANFRDAFRELFCSFCARVSSDGESSATSHTIVTMKH
ncbi:motilin receptor-like [Liolophura sinensis]|uniref:motilin receptor-like n=1 Tax=Liolophura sinensis TaxID=3198878 RepID=UPI0031595834